MKNIIPTLFIRTKFSITDLSKYDVFLSKSSVERPCLVWFEAAR
jgi:hypothetical protein